jgi:hypothetical protein
MLNNPYFATGTGISSRHDPHGARISNSVKFILGSGSNVVKQIVDIPKNRK